MKPTYPTEFLGTYFLVLTMGLTAVAGTPFAPLAIGAALTVTVFMGGHVLGAHYNPAVTLAIWMRGKLPARDVVPYWAAQLAGAVMAALTVRVVTGQTFADGPISGGAFNPAVGVGPAIVRAFAGEMGPLGGAWVYVVGPVAGAALAALFFRVQNPEPVPGRAIPAAPQYEPSVVEGDYTAPKPGSAGASSPAS